MLGLDFKLSWDHDQREWGCGRSHVDTCGLPMASARMTAVRAGGATGTVTSLLPAALSSPVVKPRRTPLEEVMRARSFEHTAMVEIGLRPTLVRLLAAWWRPFIWIPSNDRHVHLDERCPRVAPPCRVPRAAPCDSHRRWRRGGLVAVPPDEIHGTDCFTKA